MPRLTMTLINQATARAKDYMLWDASMPGFGVRIYPTGRKVFFLQGRLKRRTCKLTIGRVGVLPLDRARAQAQQYLADMALGIDPRTTPHTHNTSLARLATRYLEEHARPHKQPTTATYDAQLLRLYILPALGQRDVTSITRADILTFAHRMQDTPTAANRCLALLSHMFRMAVWWGMVPQGTTPVHGVPRYRETARERFLAPEELARLGATLHEAETARLEHPQTIAAIRLLLYTGARVQEVLRLRWEQVDLRQGRIRLPESKTGATTRYLGAAAVEVFRSLPRRLDVPWVFPSLRGGPGPMGRLKHQWARIRRQAGIEDVRLHDLRHTFGAYGAEAGLSLLLIGKALGHRQARTTERYAHLAPHPVEHAVQTVSDTIARALGT